jgi:CrcB protein
MASYLAVAFGGAFGSVARYFAAGSVYGRLGAGFPYGTLVVNVMGCSIIGHHGIGGKSLAKNHGFP